MGNEAGDVGAAGATAGSMRTASRDRGNDFEVGMRGSARIVVVMRKGRRAIRMSRFRIVMLWEGYGGSFARGLLTYSVRLRSQAFQRYV